MYKVYIITNLLDNKLYVGVTSNSLKFRFRSHCSQGTVLTRAIKKHGKHNFTISLIEEFNNKKEAFIAEQKYIKQFNSKAPNGYNLTDGGESPAITEEVKRKISTSKKLYKFTDQHIQKIREASKINGLKRKGVKRPAFSEEWCKNMSKAHIGKKLSEEHKKKISTSIKNSIKYKNRKNNNYFKLNNPSKCPILKQIIAEKKYKPIICVNTNTTYPSIKHAAKDLNLRAGSISNAIRRNTTLRGLEFKKIGDN